MLRVQVLVLETTAATKTESEKREEPRVKAEVRNTNQTLHGPEARSAAGAYVPVEEPGVPVRLPTLGVGDRGCL